MFPNCIDSTMFYLDDFLTKIYLLLVGKDEINNNIVRKHTRKLETLGDVSFPLDIKKWFRLTNNKEHNVNTIFEYASKINGETINLDSLITISKTWPITINKCLIIKDSCHVYFDREFMFKHIIKDVSIKTATYGSYNINIPDKISIKSHNIGLDLTNMSLSDLRISILIEVTKNLLTFNNYDLTNDVNSNCREILFTNKSSVANEDVILCGPILNLTGTKEVSSTASDYYKQRVTDMRLMAEHKYGLRITSKPGWEDFFVKLGEAAVTIELMKCKPTQPTTIDINNHYIANASFIMYNCARLEALFNEYDKKVINNIFPTLPPIENIDFNLLVQPEEWELLYVHVLQFPHIIKNCIKDILDLKINIHYLLSMLSTMCSIFSVYYRRVRILTDRRNHLFPVLHARIYLLKAVRQILHNGLLLLNIQPIKQM